MFTLTNASYDTKQALKWLGIGIAVLIGLFFLVKVLFFIKEVIFPTPPAKPTVAFGKLQPAFFPDNKSNKKFTYTINTNTGVLPTFKNQIKVYVINPNEPDLLALNKMQDKFDSAGYAGAPIKLSDQLYRFQSDPNRSGISKAIDGNIVDSSFSINSNFLNDNDVLSASGLPDEKHAIELSSRLLESTSFLSEDLDLDKTKTHLFAIANNSLSPATSLSNSQVIEVDYYQKDVNSLPIYYEDPFASNIKILVAGGSSEGQIVAGKYIHQEVSENSSTYPVISTDEALDKLKTGKGYISSYAGSSSDISITNVFEAYYISSKPQDFLTPIYIFVGNDGFYAYVPAVKDEWISN